MYCAVYFRVYLKVNISALFPLKELVWISNIFCLRWCFSDCNLLQSWFSKLLLWWQKKWLQPSSNQLYLEFGCKWKHWDLTSRHAVGFLIQLNLVVSVLRDAYHCIILSTGKTRALSFMLPVSFPKMIYTFIFLSCLNFPPVNEFSEAGWTPPGKCPDTLMTGSLEKAVK